MTRLDQYVNPMWGREALETVPGGKNDVNVASAMM